MGNVYTVQSTSRGRKLYFRIFLTFEYFHPQWTTHKLRKSNFRPTTTRRPHYPNTGVDFDKWLNAKSAQENDYIYYLFYFRH